MSGCRQWHQVSLKWLPCHCGFRCQASVASNLWSNNEHDNQTISYYAAGVATSRRQDFLCNFLTPTHNIESAYGTNVSEIGFCGFLPICKYHSAWLHWHWSNKRWNLLKYMATRQYIIIATRFLFGVVTTGQRKQARKLQKSSTKVG